MAAKILIFKNLNHLNFFHRLTEAGYKNDIHKMRIFGLHALRFIGSDCKWRVGRTTLLG